MTALCGSCLLLVASLSWSQSPARVLLLPEITVTSFRGELRRDKTKDSATGYTVPAPQPGQSFQPVHLPPGMRIDVSYLLSSHAVISFGAVGGCMITEGSSLRIPESAESDMTVTFDRHIGGSPNHLFLNINATEMAKQGGAVFRTKNKFEGNRSSAYKRPNVIFTTTGGRFFILDQQTVQNDLNDEGISACTVGAFDGNAMVEELSTKQQVTLKAGQVVVVTLNGIGQPRAPTKGELSYDLGCKLAALGREVPARLPPSMKTTASTSSPGTKVNSLGMVFVPVPGTKVLICVHETRYQDFMPYLAAVPVPAPNQRPRATAHGLWGWEDHPVTTSWDEALAFCAWLSQKEGKKFRLPTDEEWSHAVGIGSKEKRKPDTTPEELGKKEVGDFPWGSTWPPPPGSANLGDVSHFTEYPLSHDDSLGTYDDGFAETAPVMSFKPNKLGIYDLAGNVSEWCDDWFNGTRQRRVARGSGWQSCRNSDIRSSYRTSLSTDQNLTAGFRIVLEQP